MPPELSIVMPAYNERPHIERCLGEWHDEVVSRLPGTEVVVVDDCSADGTGAVLEQAAAAWPWLRVVRLTENVGHGRAVRRGLEESRGVFVFQTDSDRQHVPADFWRLWARRDEADFVFGVREARADGPFRATVSLVMRVVLALFWSRWVADANCPFKLMRRDALRSLLSDIPRESFIPMVMVSLLARHRGYAVQDVAVRHLPRTAGQQSLKGLARWARIGLRCTRELLALRMHEGRRARGAAGRGERA